MEANDRDLRAAKARGVTGPLFDRSGNQELCLGVEKQLKQFIMC